MAFERFRQTKNYSHLKRSGLAASALVMSFGLPIVFGESLTASNPSYAIVLTVWAVIFMVHFVLIPVVAFKSVKPQAEAEAPKSVKKKSESKTKTDD